MWKKRKKSDWKMCKKIQKMFTRKKKYVKEIRFILYVDVNEKRKSWFRTARTRE